MIDGRDDRDMHRARRRDVRRLLVGDVRTAPMIGVVATTMIVVVTSPNDNGHPKVAAAARLWREGEAAGERRPQALDASIMCAGFDAAGIPCRNAANVLADGQPVCNWHAQIHAEHGTLNAPGKKKWAKATVEEVEASANGDGVADLDLDIPGGLDAVMGTLRQRVAGTGREMFGEIEAVFRDGLKAKKATQGHLPAVFSPLPPLRR
jgi:hypothetical protein